MLSIINILCEWNNKIGIAVGLGAVALGAPHLIGNQIENDSDKLISKAISTHTKQQEIEPQLHKNLKEYIKTKDATPEGAQNVMKNFYKEQPEKLKNMINEKMKEGVEKDSISRFSGGFKYEPVNSHLKKLVGKEDEINKYINRSKQLSNKETDSESISNFSKAIDKEKSSSKWKHYGF